MQRAEGYKAIVVGGEVTLENDEPTGALPGRLVRGAQSAGWHGADRRSEPRRPASAQLLE